MRKQQNWNTKWKRREKIKENTSCLRSIKLITGKMKWEKINKITKLTKQSEIIIDSTGIERIGE